jgi:hypothetical protein
VVFQQKNNSTKYRVIFGGGRCENAWCLRYVDFARKTAQDYPDQARAWPRALISRPGLGGFSPK